jgi:hypothetical protein
MRFYIYAGTHEQAKHLAKQMKLGTNEWTYVSGVERLHGIREGVMLCYGAWTNREDNEQVHTMARVCQMSMLYVN